MLQRNLRSLQLNLQLRAVAQNLLRHQLLSLVVVEQMAISQQLNLLLTHSVLQLEHHVRQQMPVGTHIHIKSVRQEKLLARSSMSLVESLVQSNTVQVCRRQRQSLWSIKIQKHRSLKSATLA